MKDLGIIRRMYYRDGLSLSEIERRTGLTRKTVRRWLNAAEVLNYFAPELMATRVFGFTLTWLILGVLFFPFVWAIAWVFIRRSIALEETEVAEVKRGEGEKERTP